VGLHWLIRGGFYTSAGQEGVSKKMEREKGGKGEREKGRKGEREQEARPREPARWGLTIRNL
jgi:hypothetical protein